MGTNAGEYTHKIYTTELHIPSFSILKPTSPPPAVPTVTMATVSWPTFTAGGNGELVVVGGGGAGGG